jgi:predicted RNase H-like HicB family nuclease
MTYKAVAEREPGWWIIQVPELGVTTQARRLGEIENNAREAIAVWLDIAPDSFTVDVIAKTPAEIAARLDEAKALAAKAAAEQIEASRMTSEAVRQLIEALGVSCREAGSLVGLSHQRVAQLAGKRPASPAARTTTARRKAS